MHQGKVRMVTQEKMGLVLRRVGLKLRKVEWMMM
jgi:hypothetical protein